MAHVLKYTDPAARQFTKKLGREEAQARAAYLSRVVYIGNLAFVTTDVQLHALFSRCGVIERVIMGLNRVTKQPCGFAFVIFMLRESAVAAVSLLHGSTLDERSIKVEMDKGWYPGREFGRGETGAQVRDELRTGYDEGRGGYSVREQQQAGGAVGGGVGAEEGGVLTRPGFSEDRDSRDARARRFSGGPGGGGGYRPRGSFGSGGGSPYPRPAYGGGWGDRPPPRDSYGASGGGDGGAGSKRRRADYAEPEDAERHRPFRAGGEYGGAAADDAGRAADAPAAEGEGGRRRRGGGGGADGDEGLPEVDEFGREVRRE